jgi:hypothetical protein
MSGPFALKLDDVSRWEEVVEEGLRLLANPHSYPAACNRAFVVLQREGDCVATILFALAPLIGVLIAWPVAKWNERGRG